MSKAEVQEYIDLGTWAMEDDDPLKQALQRGIGVHHSGLPTKYRQVVEILFRCGHLRLVLATGRDVLVVTTCSAAGGARKLYQSPDKLNTDMQNQ